MSLVVNPGAQNPSHHLSLSDGENTFGFILAEEDSWREKVIRINPSRRGLPPGESSLAPVGKVKAGQHTWSAGRSRKTFWENNRGFFDAEGVWTVQDGKLSLGLQQQFGKGKRKACEYLPGSMGWHSLCSDGRIVILDFIPAENLNVQNIGLWLKLHGEPQPLSIELREDSLPDLSGFAGIFPDWRQLAALETENLSEFDATYDPYSGRLAASSSSSFEGGNCLAVSLDGGLSVDAAYVELTDPAGEDLTCTEFAFHPNSLNMSNLDNFFLMAGLDSSLGVYPFELRLIYSSADGYSVAVKYRTDTASFNISESKLISNTWHTIRVVWQASSEAGADDGYIRFYVDDDQIDSINDLDNDTFQINIIRYGCTSGLDSTTTGTIYFDDLCWGDSAGSPAASRFAAINGQRGLAIKPVFNEDQFVRMEPEVPQESIRIALDIDISDLEVDTDGGFDLLQLHSDSQMVANLEIDFSGSNGFSIDTGGGNLAISSGKRKLIFEYSAGDCDLWLDGIKILEWSGPTQDIEKIDIGVLNNSGSLSGCLAIDNIRWAKEGQIWEEWFNFDDQLPGNLMLQTEVSSEEFIEKISQMYECHFEDGSALIQDSRYNLLLRASSTDAPDNCWLVGVDRDGSGAVQGNTDSGWGDAGFNLYRRLTENDMPLRKLHYFEFRNALYAVGERGDIGNSKIYLNGDRGTATGAGTITIENSSKSWQINQWKDAFVKIIAGAGRGQYRKIILNDESSLTVPHWHIEPDSTSEYVIYGTKIWNEISWTGNPQTPGKIINVCVLNDAVHLARGQALNALRMKYDASSDSHIMQEENDLKVEGFYVFSDEINGLQLWNRAGNVISASSPVGWGYTFSFQNSFTLGDQNLPINNLIGFNGELYALKADGIFVIRENPIRIGEGEGYFASPSTGCAAVVHKDLLLFNAGDHAIYGIRENSDLSTKFIFSMEALKTKQGRVTDLLSHPGGLLVVQNGGDETHSSIQFWDDQKESWHETYRSWMIGKRVNSIYWQLIPGANPCLWINAGGESVFQRWPATGFDLSSITDLTYLDQGWLKSSIIDLGVPGNRKWIQGYLINLIDIQNEDWGIHLDYQVDDGIDTEIWQSAGEYSGIRQLHWNLECESFQQLRFRVLIESGNQTSSPEIDSILIDMILQPEVNFCREIKANLPDDGIDLLGDHGPDAAEVIGWLQDRFTQGSRLTLGSLWSARNDIDVFLDEVRWEPLMGALGTPQESGRLTLKLRSY